MHVKSLISLLVTITETYAVKVYTENKSYIATLQETCASPQNHTLSIVSGYFCSQVHLITTQPNLILGWHAIPTIISMGLVYCMYVYSWSYRKCIGVCLMWILWSQIHLPGTLHPQPAIRRRLAGVRSNDISHSLYVNETLLYEVGHEPISDRTVHYCEVYIVQ